MYLILFIVLILILVFILSPSEFPQKEKENQNRLKSFFSINSMTDKLLVSVIRFPITIVFILGLAGLFFMEINNSFDPISYRLWFFFTVGVFISSSISLFTEDYFSQWKSYGLTFFTVLFWGVYCYMMPENIDDLSTTKIIEISVLSGAAFLSMFFISFFTKSTDRAFWNFVIQTLFHLVLAAFFGVILYGGLSLALLGIDTLFNIRIDWKVYANLAVVCFAIVAPLYFLAHIPDQEAKKKTDIANTKALEIFALYIITPILAVYAMILYAYLGKIIIAWELPIGWVSWLVSALALGGLFLVAIVYPIRETKKNKIVEFLSRWLGLIIFPLLVLMTIGIFYRINEYGLTINRAYILILNFWFYGVYTYLFFTKSRHIKWILISPVIVALLSSISYWGVAAITKKSLIADVKIILDEQLTIEEVGTIFSEMTELEKKKIMGKLEYLHKHFGKETVQPFFAQEISTNHWRFLSQLGLKENSTQKREWIGFSSNPGKKWPITEYNSFVKINYTQHRKNENVNYALHNGIMEIDLYDRKLTLPLNKIIDEYFDLEENLRNEKELRYQGDDYLILISSLYGNYYPEKDSVQINSLMGFLFFD